MPTERSASTWGPDSGAPQRIDCLHRTVLRLVAERQLLHERRAGRDELESNRLEIGRLNRELSQALIARHLASHARRAA